jgi:hypothetical protein
MSFNQVAGSRDGSPAHLTPKAEPFMLREVLRMPIDREGQLVRIMENMQLPMVSAHLQPPVRNEQKANHHLKTNVPDRRL